MPLSLPFILRTQVNVYQMIESLAAGLSQPHLDLLFNKFQGRKERSLTDTLRLLDLLRKLATNDLKVWTVV